MELLFLGKRPSLDSVIEKINFCPGKTGFMSVGFEAFIADVESALDRQSEIDILVVSFDGYSVIKAHEEENLFDSLLEKQVKSKAVLDKLHSAKFVSVFIFSENAFDVVFEVALSCRYRIALRKGISVGFPGFSTGYLPLLGVLERKLATPKKSQRFRVFRSFPSIPVVFGVEAGVVDISLAVSDYDKLIGGWVRTLESGHCRLEGIWGKKGPIPRWGVGSWGERVERSVISWFDSVKKNSAPGVIELSLESSCRALLQNNLKFTSLLTGASVGASKFSEVFIDVSDHLPQTDLLMKVLARECFVVLYCESRRTLQNAIEIIFSRLERSLRGKDQLDYFKSRFGWFSSDGADRLGNSIKPLSCGRMLVNVPSHSQEIQFVTGFLDRTSDVCEVFYCEDRAWLEYVRFISNFVHLSGNEAVSGMYLSCFMRSYAFQELIGIASFSGKPLKAVLMELEGEGFGFLSKLAEWELFLGARFGLYGYSCRTFDIGECSFIPEIWEVCSIREAEKVVAKRLYLRSPFPLSISGYFLWLGKFVSGQLEDSFSWWSNETRELLFRSLGMEELDSASENLDDLLQSEYDGLTGLYSSNV